MVYISVYIISLYISVYMHEIRMLWKTLWGTSPHSVICGSATGHHYIQATNN